jgi:hypothetical protein
MDNMFKSDTPDLFNQPKLSDAPRFDGSNYEPELDHARLTGQLHDIYNLMKDGKWRTLSEIEEATGHPQASISAQLRNMRKARFVARFGNYLVSKQRRGDRKAGLFEYKIEFIPASNQ